MYSVGTSYTTSPSGLNRSFSTNDKDLGELKKSFDKCFGNFINFSNSITKYNELAKIAPLISQGFMTLETFIDKTVDGYFREKFQDESLASNFQIIIKNFITKKQQLINNYLQKGDVQQAYGNLIGELSQSRNEIQFNKEWRQLTVEPRKSLRHVESNPSDSPATLTTPAPLGSSDSTPISAEGPSISDDDAEANGIINRLINAVWVFEVSLNSKSTTKAFPLIGMEFKDHNSEKVLIFKFLNNGFIDEHSIKYDMPFGQSPTHCQRIKFNQILQSGTVNYSHPDNKDLVFKSQSEFESELDKLNKLSNHKLTNLFPQIQKPRQQTASSNSQDSPSKKPPDNQAQYKRVVLKLAGRTDDNTQVPPKKRPKIQPLPSPRNTRACQAVPSTQADLAALIWTQLSQLTGVYQDFKHRLSDDQNKGYVTLINQLQGEVTNFQLNINNSDYDKLKLKIRTIFIRLEVDILMIKDVQLKLAGHISDEVYVIAKSQHHRFSPSRDTEFEQLSQLKNEVEVVEMETIDALEKKIHGLFLKNETNKLLILLNDRIDNDLLKKFNEAFPNASSKNACGQALLEVSNKYFNPKNPLSEPSDSPNETHTRRFFELDDPLKNLLYTNALVSFCKTELIPDALIKIFDVTRDRLFASPFGRSLINALSYVIITKFPGVYLITLNEQQLIKEKVKSFFEGLAKIDLLDIKKSALATTNRTTNSTVVLSPGNAQTGTLSVDDFIKLSDFNSKISKINDLLKAMHSESTSAIFQQSNTLSKLVIPDSEKQNALRILNILYQILIEKNAPMDSTSQEEIKKSLYLAIAKEILNDETDTDCESLNISHTRTINLIFSQVKFTGAVPASYSPAPAPVAAPVAQTSAPPVAATSAAGSSSSSTGSVQPPVHAVPTVVAQTSAPPSASGSASSAAGASSSAAGSSSSSIGSVQPPVQAVPIVVAQTSAPPGAASSAAGSSSSLIGSVQPPIQAVPILAPAPVQTPHIIAPPSASGSASSAAGASSSAAGSPLNAERSILNNLFSLDELDRLINGVDNLTTPSDPGYDFTAIKELESSETLMLPFMIQASLSAPFYQNGRVLVRNCASLLIKDHGTPEQKLIGEGLIAGVNESEILYFTEYIKDYMQRRQPIMDPFPIEIIRRAIEQNAYRGHSYSPYLPITDKDSNILCWTLDYYHMFEDLNVQRFIKTAPTFLVISNDEYSRFGDQIKKYKRDTTPMSGLLKTTESVITTTMHTKSKYFNLVRDDISSGPIDGTCTVQPKKMKSQLDQREFNFSLHPIPADLLVTIIGRDLHDSLTRFNTKEGYSVDAWYGLNPQSRKLYKRYKDSTKLERSDHKKLMLFHGTSPSSVPEIFENNFNSLKTTNEVFGHGVYGSQDLRTTIYYAHRAENPNCPKLPTVQNQSYGSANYPDQFSVVVVKVIGPSAGFKEYDTSTLSSRKSLSEQVGEGQWGKKIKDRDYSIFLTTGGTDVGWIPVAVLRLKKQK